MSSPPSPLLTSGGPPPALTPLRRTGRNHPVDAVATGLAEAYLLGCQGSGANSPGRSQWHIFISWHNVPRVSFMSLWETAPTLPGVCTSSAHSVPICSRGMGIPHLPWAGGWGRGVALPWASSSWGRTRGEGQPTLNRHPLIPCWAPRVPQRAGATLNGQALGPPGQLPGAGSHWQLQGHPRP